MLTSMECCCWNGWLLSETRSSSSRSAYPISILCTYDVSMMTQANSTLNWCRLILRCIYFSLALLDSHLHLDFSTEIILHVYIIPLPVQLIPPSSGRFDNWNIHGYWRGSYIVFKARHLPLFRRTCRCVTLQSRQWYATLSTTHRRHRLSRDRQDE